MSHRTLILVALTLPTMAVAQTPEQVVQKFVSLVNARKVDALAALVQNANVSVGVRAILSNPQMPPISVTKLATKITGNTARVTLVFSSPAMTTKPESESVTLVKSGKTWLLKPDKANPGNVNSIVQMCVEQSVVFSDAKDRMYTRKCTEGLTELAVATMLTVSEQGNVFRLTASNWQAKITPYVKGKFSFGCMTKRSKGSAFAFNGALTGTSSAKLRSLGTLVMLYEGSGGKLFFHPDGLAGVAFADGSVKRVTATQAKKLRWKS